MRYEFHPEAEAEFLESVSFYESKVPGLGRAFIEEFEVVVDLVCASPKQRRIECDPDIRLAPLRRFPFSLVYREKQEAVQLLAVAHDRRRPLYWSHRLNASIL